MGEVVKLVQALERLNHLQTRIASRKESITHKITCVPRVRLEHNKSLQRALLSLHASQQQTTMLGVDARTHVSGTPQSGYAAPGGHQRNTALAMLRLTEVPSVEVDNFAAWWDNQTSERQTAAWDLVNYLYLEHPTSMETYVHLQVTGKA